MTPAGHASIAYLMCFKLKKPFIFAMLIGSIIPDVDFILLPFDFFNSMHRILTHNLFFILLFSILFSIFFKEDKLKVFLLTMAGALLHLFIDSIIDSNPSNGIGIAWLWPISDKTYSPFNLVSPESFVVGGWSNAKAMFKELFRLIIFEIPFILLALFILTKNKYYHVIKKYLKINKEDIH